MNREEKVSVLEAIKDTMEVYCADAGMESTMRVCTEHNGMYHVISANLLESIKRCDNLDGSITMVTGVDPVGREYPVTLPFADIRLILDEKNLVAYETDTDYFSRLGKK